MAMAFPDPGECPKTNTLALLKTIINERGQGIGNKSGVCGCSMENLRRSRDCGCGLPCDSGRLARA
jgi:hypothetical protein